MVETVNKDKVENKVTEQKQAPKPQPAHRKKITFNLKFTLVLIVIAGSFGVGVHFLHAFQVDRNADNLLHKSRQATERGDLNEAVRFLRSYLGFRPHDPEAVAELAQLLDQKAVSGGDLVQVYFSYEEALRQNPDRNDLRRRIAEISVRVGRYKDALDHIKVLEKKQGPDAELSLLAAQCYLAEDKVDDAVRKYLSTIQFDQSNVQAYAMLAGLFKNRLNDLPKLHELEGFEAPAALISLFPPKREAIPEVDPTNIPLRPEERINAILDLMVQFGEPKFEAYLHRARVRLDNDQLELAAEDIAAATELEKQNMDVHLVAANLALKQAQTALQNDQKESAVQHIDRMIELANAGLKLADSSPIFYLTLFQAEQFNGDFKAAQKRLEEGIVAVTAAISVAGLEQRGELQLMRPQFVTTLADLLINQALQNPGPSATAQLAQAEELVQQLKKSFAVSWHTQYLEGRLHFARDEWNLAIPKFERVRNLLQQNVEVRRNIDIALGVCYRKLNNPDRRIVVFRRAVENDPFWMFARLELARALSEANRVDDAIQAYQLLGNIPGASVEFAQLLLLRELGKPADQRKWDVIQQTLQAEINLRQKEGLPTPPQVAVVSAELLWQQGKKGEANELLKQARLEHPMSSGVVAVQVNLIMVDPTLEMQQRIEQSLQLLNSAEATMGDSLELQTARVRVVSALPQEEANTQLDQLAEKAFTLNPEDQSQLLRRIAQAYLSIGNQSAAKAVWQRLSETEIDPITTRLAVIEFALREGDEGQVSAQLEEIRNIEGPGGPYGNVVHAQQLLRSLKIEEGQQVQEANQKVLVKVRELLAKALAQRTSWNIVNRLLGDVERMLGNQDVAFEHYRRAIDQGDHTREIVGYVVETLYQKKNFQDADLILKRVSEKSPEVVSGDLARMAWRVAWQQQQYDTALGLASSLTDETRDFQDYIWLSRLRFAEGARDATVEDPLRDAIQHFPKEPQVWLAYVSFLERVGRIEDGKKELSDAAKILPQEPPSLIPMTLARGYELLNLKDEAEQQYLAALASDSKNASILVQLADFYSRNNQFAKAEPHLTALFDPKLNAPETLRNWAQRRRAQTIASSGNYADLERALKLLDASPEADAELTRYDLRTKAQILSTRNTKTDKRKLIGVLEEIRNRKSSTQQERLQLAKLYDDTENWTAAKAEFESLLKDAPNLPAAQLEFVNALIKHKELEEARTWFERAKTFSPEDLSIALLDIRLLHAAGKSTEALEKLNQYAQDEARLNNLHQVLRDLLSSPDGRSLLDQFRIAAPTEDPTQVANFQEGLRLLREGGVEQSLKMLSPILDQPQYRDPLKAFYARSASRLLAQLDLNSQAEEHWRTAQALHSRPEDVVQLIALVAKQNRVSAALDLCEQELWGKQSDALAAQSTVAVLRSGKPTSQEMQRAEAMIVSAIKKQPSAALVRHLADFKDLAGEHEQAVSLYQQVLQQNNKDLIALNNMAYLSALLGKNMKEALDSIDTAISIAGPIGALLDTRGVVYLQRGETQKAIADLTKAIDETPSAASQFRLAQAYLKQGDKAKAQEAFADAQSSGLESSSVHPLEKEMLQKFPEVLTGPN